MRYFEKIFVTGDTHGDFRKINMFSCQFPKESRNDMALIILGDVGCTYYTDKRAERYMESLVYALDGITAICIRGNHEKDPSKLPDLFEKQEIFGGPVYIAKKFPSIIFLADGYEYTFNDMKFFAAGGAYSVDKFYRLSNGAIWYDDEQLDDEAKQRCMENSENKEFDFVLTHTCPVSAEPVEDFLSFINQGTVDKTMEIFFEDLKNKISFNYWLAGHYHTDKYKLDGKLRLMFNDFIDITNGNIREWSYGED